MDKEKPIYQTKYSKDLLSALLKRGVKAIPEYYDGHKTVDIAILPAHIFIEVDGMHHFTDPKQILSDFKRYHYSDGDDFSTFYVPNYIIKDHLEEVADALAKVTKLRTDVEKIPSIARY